MYVILHLVCISRGLSNLHVLMQLQLQLQGLSIGQLSFVLNLASNLVRAAISLLDKAWKVVHMQRTWPQ